MAACSHVLFHLGVQLKVPKGLTKTLLLLTSSNSCELMPTLAKGSSTNSSSMLPDFLFFFRPSNFCFLSSSVRTHVVFMPAASHSLQATWTSCIVLPIQNLGPSLSSWCTSKQKKTASGPSKPRTLCTVQDLGSGYLCPVLSIIYFLSIDLISYVNFPKSSS